MMEIIEIDPNKKYIFNLSHADDKGIENFMRLIKALTNGTEQFFVLFGVDFENIPDELFSKFLTDGTTVYDPDGRRIRANNRK